MTQDFLIIGGGIAGLSAGARLSDLGTVTLLEAEDALGYHSSGRSAALYEAQYGQPPVVALSIASGAHYHAGGYLKPRGTMLVAGADDRDRFEEEARTFKLDHVTMTQAREIVPILNPETVAYAAWHDNAWDIDTDRQLQDFARQIRAKGGAVITGARVTAIARDGTGWTVEAGDTYRARTLVNAAGAWADTVATMAGIAPMAIRPFRRSMARIPAPGGHDISAWPMLIGVNDSWYAKPDAGMLLVSPSEEDPAEPHDAWADDMVLAEGLARYEAMVTEPVTRLAANWAGLRSFAPDRVLVLGPDPDQRDFIWCAGQGGYGFQTAPAASQFLADLVAGRASDLDAETQRAIRPERLR